MRALRRLWRWLFGSSEPVELFVRFANESGLENIPQMPRDVREVRAVRGGRRLEDDRARKLAYQLWVEDGFYSTAVSRKYVADGEVVDPEDVPPDVNFTLIEIECQVPTSKLNDLES